VRDIRQTAGCAGASMARPFNNYGPGLKITDGRVLPDFAKDMCSRAATWSILSDGSSEAHLLLCDRRHHRLLQGAGARRHLGEPYNVGIDRPEISVAQLAEQVCEGRRRSSCSAIKGKVRARPQCNEADYLIDNPNRRCPGHRQGAHCISDSNRACCR
jgi:UDP-glucuronate decarboxylase